MRGTIFNIQRFSTLDGPGIRTTVYLQGCNLSCRWCHNPESIAATARTQYFDERCAACGRCVAACPAGCHSLDGGAHRFDRSSCRNCGRCAEACGPEALTLGGRALDHSEVVETASRDKAYFDNSGGGLTLSGGEPLLQADFCRRVLEESGRLGISTAVDSALNVPFGVVESLAGFVDLWLIDVKHADSAAHRRLTGVPNAPILENLRRLLESEARVWIRLPLIKNLNDDIGSVEALGKLLVGGRPPEAIDLLPYHNYGVNKAKSAGMERQTEEFLPPDPERTGEIRRLLREMGLPCR